MLRVTQAGFRMHGIAWVRAFWKALPVGLITCNVAYSQPSDRYSEARVQAKILAERCADNNKRDQCILFIWAILDTLTIMAPEQACFPIAPHPTAGVAAYSNEIYVGAIKALADTARFAPTAPAADVVTRYLADTYKCSNK
jgi:hypothetical protein